MALHPRLVLRVRGVKHGWTQSNMVPLFYQLKDAKSISLWFHLRITWIAHSQLYEFWIIAMCLTLEFLGNILLNSVIAFLLLNQNTGGISLLTLRTKIIQSSKNLEYLPIYNSCTSATSGSKVERRTSNASSWFDQCGLGKLREHWNSLNNMKKIKIPMNILECLLTSHTCLDVFSRIRISLRWLQHKRFQP